MQSSRTIRLLPISQDLAVRSIGYDRLVMHISHSLVAHNDQIGKRGNRRLAPTYPQSCRFSALTGEQG